MKTINFIKNFFSKGKPVYLDLYTNNKLAYDYFSVKATNKFVPEWWRELPAYHVDTDSGLKSASNTYPTAKHCPGIVDTFKYTFGLPLWSDLTIAAKGGGEAEVKYPISSENDFVYGSGYRRGEFYREGKYLHLELETPWQGVSSDTSVNWYYTPASWHYDAAITDNLWFLPGILNFKYSHLTNFQLLMHDFNHSVDLAAGTVMMYLVPMTEREVIVRSHYDPEYFHDLTPLSLKMSFMNSYQKKQKFLRRIDGE